MQITTKVLAFAIVIVGGCRSAPDEHVRPTEGKAPLDQPVSASATIAGFSQTFTTTKFQTGSGVTTFTEPGGMTKWAGSNGVFSINDIGVAAGVLNAGVHFKPFGGGLAAHEELVKTYFLAAGLPSDQAGSMRTNVAATGDGTPDSAEIPSEFAYSSIITRQVAGFAVAESHAWAKLDDAGNVMGEDVYWPPLDGSVVSDAQALATQLADGIASAKYLSGLPAGLGAGTVRIHHSSQYVRGAFVNVACYDARSTTADDGGWVRHFDKNGVEIRLPQELRAGAPSAKL